MNNLTIRFYGERCGFRIEFTREREREKNIDFDFVRSASVTNLWLNVKAGERHNETAKAIKTKQQSFLDISELQLNYCFVEITNFIKLFIS